MEFNYRLIGNMKTLVASFGRMNPPHIGHIELIEYVELLSKQLNGDSTVFLSHSQNNKKNPLLYDLKSKLLHKWSNGIVYIDYDTEIKQPMNILHYANKHQYDNVYFICGKDRFQEYKKSFIEFARSRDYFKFNHVEVIQRPDSDICITGTEMRTFVQNDDRIQFDQYCPKQATIDEKQLIFDHVKRVINK